MTDAINNTDHGQDTKRISIEAPTKEASMTDMITTTTNRKTEQKLTAAQVEKKCPETLQTLGKRIAAHFDKARKCEAKAEQHYTAIAQLLVKAEEACDGDGFTAFREKFFPNLGKSRVYELLAIASDKKSVEETKASTRARVQRHRAIKAAASVTVTENAVSARGPQIDADADDPEYSAEKHEAEISAYALAKLKDGIDHLVPVMDDAAKEEAVGYLLKKIREGAASVAVPARAAGAQ
jgi:hypothetical protein